MVRSDGTPVKGAVVTLDTAAFSSDTSYDSLTSTTTNANGAFSILRQRGGGTYTIYAEYNNKQLVALIRNVQDTGASDVFHEINVGSTVMLPPGFIAGTVLVDEASQTGTLCYVPGSSLIAVTDDNGNFVMSGIPPGSYAVYFSHADYLIGKALQVNVVSNDTSRVGTITLSYDPNKPVPTPRLVTAAYDTLHGVVQLSWHPVSVPDLEGYIVYRGLDGSAITGVDTVSAGDTVSFDTLYHSFTDLSHHACQYEVAAFDSAPNVGNRSNPVSITTVPPALVRTVFSYQVVGHANDTVESGDTVAVVATFANGKYSNTLIAWYNAYPDSALKQDSVHAQTGTDTLKRVFASSCRTILYIVAVDDHGVSWLDSESVFVLPRYVDAVSADSSTSGVTIKWAASRLGNFAGYRLYRIRSSGDTLLYTTAVRTDTVHACLFQTNGSFKYGVVEYDKLGNVSPYGKTVSAWIKNTPPSFATDTASIPKTASVGRLYSVVVHAVDVNGDNLAYKQIAGLGLAIAHDSVLWTPVITDTGTKKIAVQVSDGLGGYDTLQWNVAVLPVSVVAPGDSMSSARFSLAVAIVNNVLYAAGGARFFNSGGRLVPIPLSTVEAYPLAGTGSWAKSASLESPRYAFGCAAAYGKLFAFGGTKDDVNHFSSIDSLSGSQTLWDTAGMLVAPNAGCAVCAVGNVVYCFGGLETASGSDVVSNNIYAFDPTTGQCVLKSQMRTRRAFHQAVAINGKIYIVGGLGGALSQYDCTPQGTVEAYDPVANALIPDTLAHLATPRYYFAASDANGKIYAIGGCSSASSDAALSSIEEYDPTLNTWTYKADLPAPRSNCAAASWQGRIYVVGGIVAGNATSGVMVYYP